MSPQSGVGPVLAAAVIGYALAAALPAWLAWYATRARPESATARAFAATMAGITVWSGAYFARLFAPEWAAFGLTVLAFVGITTTPVAVLLFALQYTGRERFVTPGTTALLLVVPLVTLVLLATTPSHGLFYTTFRVVGVGPLSTTSAANGPWFWVHTAYSFGALAVASALLVAFGARLRRVYRRQAVLIVLAVLVAWGTNVAFLAGLTPLPVLDLTPVGLALAGALLALAVFRARLIDVTPVARDAVLEALDDAVIVLDGGRVVDVNDAAAALLGPGDPIGEPAPSVFPEALTTALRSDDAEPAADDATDTDGDGPAAGGTGNADGDAPAEGATGNADGDAPADSDVPTDGGTTDDDGDAPAGMTPAGGGWVSEPLVADEVTASGEDDRLVRLARSGEDRHYRVRTLPLERLRAGVGRREPTADEPPALTPAAAVADDGTRVTVLLLTDVTAQQEHLRQLRRQNRRLEEFAAAAAHDLRNPLNVIGGYVELAREEPDDAYFDRIEQATDRMSRLVEDLLSLGRRGRLVESVVPVSLAAAAERAWSGVDAGDATLYIEDGDPVPADADRLVQLLENLLVNATQHATGDGGVTVTVGRTTDGFYVADDGPGIPEAERERVFEYGFTTREAGSGFGLAVVETVADAHGWEVSVTESETGGARFEITGVDRTDRVAGAGLADA